MTVLGKHLAFEINVPKIYIKNFKAICDNKKKGSDFKIVQTCLTLDPYLSPCVYLQCCSQLKQGQNQSSQEEKC